MLVRIELFAYNFEPEYAEEEMTSRSQQHSTTEASSADGVRTLEEWCSCGNSAHERITQFDSYDTLILNPDVLSIVFNQMMMFKRQRGRAPDELNNR
jgi:hypothetical protein